MTEKKNHPAHSGDSSPEIEFVLKEYDYALSEIHLRLGFSRQVLNLQITMLGALVGGLVAFVDKHSLSPGVVQGAAVAVSFINLAFILEIRQNSVHTIICGNFMAAKLLPLFPGQYRQATGGGLLPNIRRHRERGRSRKTLYHYWSDSFLLVSSLTLLASCGAFLWALRGWPGDVWQITCGIAGGISTVASLINLWGYMIGDPRYVSKAMTSRDGVAETRR